MPELSAPFAALASRQTVTLPAVPAYGGGKWQTGHLPAQTLNALPPDVTLLQNHTLAPDGAILPSAPGTAPSSHKIIPLPDGKRPLGEFLADCLVRAAWGAAHPDFRFAGPALVPVQARLLERLGLLRDYVVLSAPLSFSVIATFASAHLPPVALTDLAPLLRANGSATGSRIAILPQHATEIFALANRASVAAWLRAKRVTLIDPDTMPFDDLARTMADAASVILADPGQAGLLALCAPGAKILEIAPAGWLTLTGRYLSALFGLDWAPCLAGPPTYKLLGALPFGARVPLSYEIQINDLAKVLQTL